MYLGEGKKKIKTFKGFTLIELLVVVAIIGILGSVGTIAYNGYTKGARVTAAKNTLMQISLAQSEHFSNAGYYWTSGEDCADSYTKTAGEAVNEEVGDGLFDNADYIDNTIQFYFCIEEAGGASGFVASAVYREGSCKLTVNDSNVVDDSSC